MKFKVIKKLYDPYTGKVKNPGDIINIEPEKEKVYGGRIKKEVSKKAVE